MEENFKSLGNEYVINLDAVAYFKIAKDGGVKIVFQGVPIEHAVDIAREYSSHLLRFLKEYKQLAPPAGTVTIKGPSRS